MLPLLLLALGVLAPAPRAAALEPPSTEAWYVMDREGWLRTDDERLVKTAYDLRNGPNLANVPFQLGEWTGQDLRITNLETFPTLDADQIVYRGYSRPDGQLLILSLVGSTRGQSFHHPLICYEWASWPAEDRGTTVVPVGAGDVVLRVVIGRDPQGPAQVDLHGYLWPNDRRNWADGATQLRVTALAAAGEDQALAAAQEFARLLFAEARRPGASTQLAPPADTPPVDTPPVDTPPVDTLMAETVPAPAQRPEIPAFR